MGGAVAGVAAATVRAQRKVIAHFVSRNAVSSAKAVEFTPEGRMETRWFDRMRDHGLILPGAGGRYWIDVDRLEAWRVRRRKRAAFGVGAALVALAAGIGIGMLG